MQEATLIPREAQRCPICGFDLSGSIAAGQPRCPECGFAFTLGELRAMNVSDPEGEPASLSPHETRISGQRLFWIVINLLVALGGLFALASLL